MIRPKLVVVNTDRDEQPRSFRDGRGYRLDMSGNKLILCAMGFVASLCFMFTLGIFVGRGLPVVKPDDFSIEGRFLRFLGLNNRTGEPSPGAAATWEDPRKMLESLNYYEDLTHKGGTLQDRRPPQALTPQPKAIAPPAATPVNEPSKEATKRAAAPPGVGNRAGSAEKPSASQPDKPRTVENPAWKYTLLVASLKEPDAQVLIEKLKSKGYSPRVESLDLGAAKWSRILLGSFPSREAAIVFADEFNRKENLEALVTSNSN
jgi:cell division septation protein DedD